MWPAGDRCGHGLVRLTVQDAALLARALPQTAGVLELEALPLLHLGAMIPAMSDTYKMIEIEREGAPVGSMS